MMSPQEGVTIFIRHDFGPVWSGWYGWFFPLLFLGAIVAVGIMLNYLFRPKHASTVDDDPLRRAARCYASGELERVEFERIQRDLGGHVDDPLRDLAQRLARGVIDVAEFDEIRGRLHGQEPPADSETEPQKT
jgi:hypothetical protein